MSLQKSIKTAALIPKVSWQFSRLGYKSHAKHYRPQDIPRSLAGLNFMVTGANSGLGLAIAKEWARRDANVWMVCRSRERGQKAAAQVATLGKGETHLEMCDLSDLSSIQTFVEQLRVSRLDGLVHNAGALAADYRESPQGIEVTLACHVVGPQKLTHGLMPVLAAAKASRVVYMTSGGMYAERLSLDDLLRPETPFDGVRAYALAKRAQVVLVSQWATRFPNLSFYATHPGWADTSGVRSALPKFYRLTKAILRTPEQGADCAVWLSAKRPIGVDSGALVFDRQVVPRHLLSETQETGQERELLWQTVESLADCS